MAPPRRPSVGDLPIECAACRVPFDAPGVRRGDPVRCPGCGAEVRVGDVGVVRTRRVRWSAQRCEERLEMMGACAGDPPPAHASAPLPRERPSSAGPAGPRGLRVMSLGTAIAALFFVLSVVIASAFLLGAGAGA